MRNVQPGRCPRCGKERPPAQGAAGASSRSEMCHDCRGFDAAAGDTSRLFHPEVRAVAGGWREARIFDGEFSGWLCPHVHATARDAESCPEKKSLLGY